MLTSFISITDTVHTLKNKLNVLKHVMCLISDKFYMLILFISDDNIKYSSELYLQAPNVTATSTLSTNLSKFS